MLSELNVWGVVLPVSALNSADDASALPHTPQNLALSKVFIPHFEQNELIERLYLLVYFLSGTSER